MAKGITRERIVATALDLLDEQGMVGITARALAARLDIRPPALYWYLRNKQHLLDEMRAAVMRRVGVALSEAVPCDTWREDLATYARIMRSEFLRHRDGARVFGGTPLGEVIDVAQVKEPWLGRAAEQGMTPDEADDALEVVAAFVVGFVIEEQEQAQQREEEQQRREQEQQASGEAADPDGTPGEEPEEPEDPEEPEEQREDVTERFERLLGVVLDGLEARSSP